MKLKKVIAAALFAGLGIAGPSQAAINAANEVQFNDGGVAGPFTDGTPGGDGVFLITTSGTLTADK